MGKIICVRDNKTFICDNKSKRKKVNTPTKENSKRRLEFDDYNAIEGDKEHVDNANNDTLRNEFQCMDVTDGGASETLQEMYELLPSVLDALESEGHLDSYLKFSRLVASNTFPMQNICFLLFLDIVEWFSTDTTTRMRYRPETFKFWQIGYRIFHGKFLRFMSGLRSSGQVLDSSSEKGLFDPAESNINFAVPSRNNLYGKKNKPEQFYPGINESAINSLVQHYGDKPLKLSVDGKKISRGKL